MLLTACKTDTGSTSSGRPATAPTVNVGSTATGGAAGTTAPQSSADGAKVAAAVALSPAEWGKGFQKSDPYEDNSLDYYVTDASCKEVLGQAPASLGGSMIRYVKVPAPGKPDMVNNLGSTSVSVFGSATDARKDYTDGKTSVGRCPSWSSDDGSAKDTGDHVVAAPTLPLTDESYAVTGTVTYKDDNGGSLPYYTLVARKGSVTLSASLDGVQSTPLSELQAQVRIAMTVMLTKLATQAR
jgi:hypothetical protein